MHFLKHTSYSLFIALLLAGISLLSSCEKNTGIQPTTPKPACRPTSIVYGSLERKYEYNADDQLIKFSDGVTFIKFEYTDSRVTKLIYYRDNDETKVNLTDQIEYNSKGQWMRHTYIEPLTSGNKVIQENTAEYDPNGNRVKIIAYVNGKPVKIYTFEYSNGNLMKQIIDQDGASVLSYTYEYDINHENELTSFESLIRFGYLYTQLGMESTPSNNMLKKVNTFDSNGSLSQTADFAYEYNSKGFPTKLTVSGGDLNGDGQVDAKDVYIWSYLYDCI